jgi:acetyl esterase/lipase
MRRRRIECLLMLLALAGTAGAPPPSMADGRPVIPMAQYWAHSELESMRLSPDGGLLAAIGTTAAGPVVLLIDAETLATRVIVRRSHSSAKRFALPSDVHWIDNDLLAVDFNQSVSEAVDKNGNHVSFLGSQFIGRRQKQGESPDWVLAYHDDRFEDIDLVNARTGQRNRYQVSLPGRLWHWAFDPAGALRAVTMVAAPVFGGMPQLSNWYRESESAPWQELLNVPMSEEYWLPMRVLAEPHTLAVYSREGRDTFGVFRYDTAARRHVELMAGHASEDLQALRGLDQEQFDFVLTMGVKPKAYWFDPRWASVQASLDAALPDRINRIQPSRIDRVLVYSYADVDPGRWYLLDTATWKLREVAARVSAIDPKHMRTAEIVQYAARDGLRITGFLTRPSRTPATPAPMVVLIHGGPWERDYWGYDPEVQMLAAQGYVVFQPEFRGSDGFGRRFKEAGYRQFGRAMQDDITDGVKYLVDQGIADRGRICIYGASYGGYAAMWGVINTPDLYRCGASYAGVSDLVDQVSFSFLNDSTIASRELSRRMVGDPDTMRDQLKQVSPIEYAADVRVPLLVAHGERDHRVLFSQSRRFVERLRGLGKDVEWMPMVGVGHGFGWTSDRMRFNAALLSFLQRHIGNENVASGSSEAAPAPNATRTSPEPSLRGQR